MKDRVLHLLRKYTGHKHIELTSRGNTAIFAALYCARKLRAKKKTVLIQDQGGWFSYRKYPKMLELKMIEIKTDLGLIEPGVLKILKDINCLIYENPAGYYAEQPAREIYEAANGSCTVIQDVSGMLGNHCTGEYADIMVGSFGRWKPVNVEYGGFVSFRDKAMHDLPREIFNTTVFDEKYLEILYEKLSCVKDRYRMFEQVNKKIKRELSHLKIAHPKKPGINVIVMYDNDLEKAEIISYCERNKYEWTQCPRYIRIMKDAISIEVKRL